MYCQLCHLPHHRFGRRFISIAHPIVVSFYHANAENSRQTIKMTLFFLLCERFPFDTNNPIGYLTAVILEYVLIGYQYFVAACTLSLGIGAYWIAIPTTEEIRGILGSIKRDAEPNENSPNELKQMFAEYIHAHATIEQLSTWLSMQIAMAISYSTRLKTEDTSENLSCEMRKAKLCSQAPLSRRRFLLGYCRLSTVFFNR